MPFKTHQSAVRAIYISSYLIVKSKILLAAFQIYPVQCNPSLQPSLVWMLLYSGAIKREQRQLDA